MMHRNIALFGSLTLLVACGIPSERDDFEDEKAVTTVAALNASSGDMDEADLDGVDPAQAAAHMASKSTRCKHAVVDAERPNVVHVTLLSCGHFGRHFTSGKLHITFSANADGSLHASTVSDGLVVDGRAEQRTVSADIRIEGDKRYVSRHVEKVGTKANGEGVSHSGDETAVTDKSTRCHTVNGTGQSLVGGNRKLETRITNLTICAAPDGDDHCPVGTIDQVNAAKGKTVHKTFDGSTTATIDIEKTKGDRREFWTLSCVPR